MNYQHLVEKNRDQAEGVRLIFVTFPHMRSPFRHFSITVHQVVCLPICINIRQK
jgi:hypothetical protein